MTCAHCGTALPEAAKFCFECGQPVTAVTSPPGYASPVAYTPKHLADKILTSRAVMEGERKQVTVVFCDLVNSTGIAERLGAEGMHALLNAFFELALTEVHRYEGTINQFLGDGIMALFGAPIAHEDDARRAVLAAVAIRRALRDRSSYMGLGGEAELALRIGVNTGLVVVGSIGDNLRMDYTAIGDTTNVAARLQQLAEPGDILVSATTARLVRGDFRVVAAGTLALKGKTQPVMTYKVLGLAPRRSALDRAGERAFGQFVGRDTELRALGEALDATLGGAGRVVSVVGDAGSGKSRLLYELRKTLGGLDIDVLEGRCRSYGGAVPYLPVVDLVRAQCSIEDTDSPEQAAGKVRTTLQALGVSVGRAPFLMGLLGIKEGAESLERLAPEAVRSETRHAVRDMLLGAARRRPVLVVIEDLHWIDTPSQSLLAALAPSIGPAPLMLVLTYRPDYPAPWLPPEATAIVLRPLSDDDSATVVRSVVQREQLPPSLMQTILAKAEGNPLFLEELTRAVIEQSEAHAGEVPETLRGVVMARIDRLPEADKRMLQTAAVLGRGFPLAVLEAVWDGPGLAADHLARLTELQFVHERPGAPEPTYAFNHALTLEVAYESLLSSHRAVLHEAAARALEKQYAGRLEAVYARLAEHWGNTDRHECAVYYLERLGDSATLTYANAEAAHAFEAAEAHARHLTDGGRTRLELLLRRAHALFMLGQLRESRDALLPCAGAFQALGDPVLLARYDLRLGAVHGNLGESALAIAAIDRAIAGAAAAGQRDVEGQAWQLLARERVWSGDFADAVVAGERALALLQAPDQAVHRGLTYWMLSLAHGLLGDFPRADDAADIARTTGEAVGDARVQANALWAEGWLRAMRGDWQAGIAACRRATALAPDAMSAAMAKGFLANSYLEAGDPQAAAPLLAEAIAAFHRFHFPQLEGWFLMFMGHARLLLGDPAGAQDAVEHGLRVVADSHFAPALAAGGMLQGWIAQAAGDFVAARGHFERALAMEVAHGGRFEAARARVALAELARASGDPARARTFAAEARAEFVALGTPVWAGRATGLAGG